MKWVLLAAILANCAGACSPKKEAENPEREDCYSDAADHARERGLTRLEVDAGLRAQREPKK